MSDGPSLDAGASNDPGPSYLKPIYEIVRITPIRSNNYEMRYETGQSSYLDEVRNEVQNYSPPPSYNEVVFSIPDTSNQERESSRGMIFILFHQLFSFFIFT